MSESAVGELKPRYSRILLKLSGESFTRSGERGIVMHEVLQIAQQVQRAAESGCQIALVIGGGNILRGSQFKDQHGGIQEATAHYMGMLATVMNSLALADTMRQEGMTARVMSAIGIEQVVEPYVRPKALQYLEEGKIVIFAAGTGNPFFTTDNQGTGLGLYLSQAFCQANYANLEYVPSEGQTCFRIICQTKTLPSV
mgnify:CR=1 FL=1